MLRGALVLIVVIGVGSFLNLRYMACHNAVMEADYARMARGIVEQSLQE